MGALTSLSKTTASLWLEASEWMLLVFACFVAIGLIGEHLGNRFSKQYKRFAMLVVIGCGGELIADGGIFLFSRHLQKLADLEVAGLQKETEVLRTRLRTQGSRASLLTEVRSQKLFEKIEPFRGQKVQVAQCGRSDNEVTLAVMSLMELLRAREWKVDSFNPFVGCDTGMRVIVRHNVPESTRAAAAALGGVLNELGLIPKDASPFTQLSEPKKSETPGWNPPTADTVLVVVLIHP